MKYPSHYVCPLSLEVMEDPVTDLCAHNFERKAILGWLATGNACCPISRKPLSEADLVANHSLAERIERWQWLKENAGIFKAAEGKDNINDETATVNDTLSLTERSTSQHDPNFLREEPSRMRKSGRKKRFGKRMQNDLELGYYEDVPTDLTLLPQERQTLRLMQEREAENEAKRRKSKIFHFVVGIGIALVIIYVGLIVISKVRYDNNDPTSETEATTKDEPLGNLVVDDAM